MKNILKGFVSGDKKLFYVINDRIKCGLLDNIMPLITRLGGPIFSVLLPVILITMTKNDTRMVGLESLTSLSASHLVVQILKRTIARLRPYDILEKINTFNIYLKDYSFPSGHTTASFSLAVSLALNYSTLMIPLIVIAGMVGISRIYLGVHYPSDVAVGAIIGTMTSITIHSMI
ncbi:phosphatase PAP2 family protein [Caldisalinibacter kiritimatiensis]|uniref:Phosphatidylglycerophosphatase B n=1 Tax=Caldisalinibacter kiritimatiensis TaxID=1304284 RepID=R1CS87_9FIRM|nr:phosphatase PAP2 family protein [Caldisalinibacter kiritimatiensis]EOC99568.1 Phosphatidylglycerophosphatase B [Caldisalinibacter kiritimatiensis]